MKQTIFFALFQTDNSQHDRMELFECDKSLQEFFDWSEDQRNQIEIKTGKKAVIHFFNIERYETP